MSMEQVSRERTVVPSAQHSTAHLPDLAYVEVTPSHHRSVLLTLGGGGRGGT